MQTHEPQAAPPRRAGDQRRLADRRGAAAGRVLHALEHVSRTRAACACTCRRPATCRWQTVPSASRWWSAVTQGGGYRVNEHELINSSPETLRAALLKEAGSEPQRPRHAARRCARHAPVGHHRHGRARAARLRRAQHRHRQGRAGGQAVSSPVARPDSGVGALYRRLLGYVRAVPWRSSRSGSSGRCCSRRPWQASRCFVRSFGDGTFVHRDPRTIVWVPLGLVGLFFLRGLGDFTQTYFMGCVGRRIVKPDARMTCSGASSTCRSATSTATRPGCCCRG